MKFVADLHIHSRFSRATSKFLNLEELDKTAGIKGVKLLGTGDFTHPLWLGEIEKELEQAEPGLFRRKKSKIGTRFMLTSEISSIYSKNGKVRKIHTLLLAPSLKDVKKLNLKLSKIGNLHSDGRPILGLDVKELAKIALDISEDFMIIPAHIWTPWFGIFGSKSGFDSLQECFEDMTKYIYAVETGLSSDPQMNWRLSMLDNITLISNSDCHSSAKIAREANVFDCKLDYFEIIDAIRKKDAKRFLYTIEFYPQEGKYHYDGHSICGYCVKPADRKNENCKKCGRKITVGVLSRVEQLADKPEGRIPKNAIPYKSMIQLENILAEVFSVGPRTKTVKREYDKMIIKFKNELSILFDTDKQDIANISGNIIAEAIMRVRDGNLKIRPGYDGEYGEIKIFSDSERKKLSNV